MLGSLSEGREMQRLLVNTDCATALRRAVTDLGADLLTMGTHNRPALARALLGTVATQFLADPPCDVLLARS